MPYLLLIGVSFLLTVCVTPLLQRYAIVHGIVDAPDLQGRKLHPRSTPLLGGMSVWVSFFVVLGVMFFFTDLLQGEALQGSILGILFAAASILIAGGYIDDRYTMPPWAQMIAPLIAAGMMTFSGVEIHVLTNPWGGVISLSLFASRVIIFTWLMVVMYTTKLLDGLDGLATGITGIGAAVLGALALFTKFYQPVWLLLQRYYWEVA